MSALRAAARIKPVVVLKAGRSLEPVPATSAEDGERRRCRMPCSMRRLRARAPCACRTYTQLFAAARILAMGRIPRGNRIAIVSNGRGPGLLAADSAVATASRSRASRRRQWRHSIRCCRRKLSAPIRWMCVPTRRPRGWPRPSPSRFRIPRSTQSWRCTSRDRWRLRWMPLARWPPWRAARRSRCWLAGWGARTGGRARSARRRRHREFLHAGECGGGVFVPGGVPPEPGMAARSSVIASRRDDARFRRRRTRFWTRAESRGRGSLPLAGRACAARAFGIACRRSRSRYADGGARRCAPHALSRAHRARLRGTCIPAARAAASATGARWRVPMANWARPSRHVSARIGAVG